MQSIQFFGAFWYRKQTFCFLPAKSRAIKSLKKLFIRNGIIVQNSVAAIKIQFPKTSSFFDIYSGYIPFCKPY